jgi:hypothetical protein
MHLLRAPRVLFLVLLKLKIKPAERGAKNKALAKKRRKK